MACYLFTYHTYGSWLPDRKQGYVVRQQGILPADHGRAADYREKMVQAEVELSLEQQKLLIATALDAVGHIDCRLHAAACETSHAHILVSWREFKPWALKRNSLKKAITIALKAKHGEQEWLSEGASRKQVKDQEHFDYLMTKYLPKHKGWKWSEARGYFL